jgi:hypothetical protein
VKCSKCDKEATRRLTVDIDIYGIPVCDSEQCKQSIQLDLIIRLWEDDYQKKQDKEAGKKKG